MGVSGLIYIDPGSEFELRWDSEAQTVILKIFSSTFYKDEGFASSFLNQSGPAPPASMTHYRTVQANTNVNFYVNTANSLPSSNTSRLTLCAASDPIAPFYEFTIVRTQTLIIWTAHRYV